MWRNVALLVVALAACRPAPADAPPPVAWGSATCSYCHMTVNTSRHAAQLVPGRGSPRVFDEAGCLLSYLAAADTTSLAQARAWVYVEDADDWLAAEAAFYQVMERPSGGLMFGILAFKEHERAAGAGGRVLTFAELLAELRS